jgi:hypothetical protein
MIKLNKESIIYIFAPSDIETGGIECTYSLAHAYKKLGFITKLILIHPSLHPQHHSNWKNIINTPEYKLAVKIPKSYIKYDSEEDKRCAILMIDSQRVNLKSDDIPYLRTLFPLSRWFRPNYIKMNDLEFLHKRSGEKLDHYRIDF